MSASTVGADDAPTRQRVARSILENGPSTAADLGQRLELTPAAVRRHLEHLTEIGAVEVSNTKRPGTRGRGRPAKSFGLTPRGRDLFDQAYDDLAVQAMRFLAETAGEEAVVEFARQRAAFIERDFAAVIQADPEMTPGAALAEVFSTHGYAATVRELPVIGEQLCQQHCPVAHVASEFPQLCEAETEAIGRALGTHVQRLATIAHGDGVCTTCIPDIKNHDSDSRRESVTRK